MVAFDGKTFIALQTNHIQTKNAQDTRGALWAAIVALLSQRAYVEDAVSQARGYVSDAIRENGQFDVGRGHGPVHHFHRLWPVKVEEDQSV